MLQSKIVCNSDSYKYNKFLNKYVWRCLLAEGVAGVGLGLPVPLLVGGQGAGQGAGSRTVAPLLVQREQPPAWRPAAGRKSIYYLLENKLAVLVQIITFKKVLMILLTSTSLKLIEKVHGDNYFKCFLNSLYLYIYTYNVYI